ncbi:hypothetical protein K469DRAFT_668319 [Zopfia rhizophila CBS 207.26]|uniref:Uncharacterized protein n=1 Tax=Zopfia rhizophila CBS 207.26 TaxID=1314779 RepID=A0A6A6DY54_9PEZI|nr:hypothetical protein K469DRAFT_668319 [Zopfia rhizophila CBS 207.26]
MLFTPENIIIYHNDLVDSDNWAAAMVMMHASLKSPSTKVIWIVEPRQVAFDLSMTRKQEMECSKLLETKFSSHGPELKTLRDLEEHNLENEDELKLAAKLSQRPKEDALLHGRLMALDFAISLTELNEPTDRTLDIFLDVETFDSIVNPMNLNVHHHEELVYRPGMELGDYSNTMTEQCHSLRVEKVRGWYSNCTAQQEKRAKNKGARISDLDLALLCATIRAAKPVKFFGGSSLGLLQRLLHRGASTNLQCYLQAGAFDLSKILFLHQFNIALDVDAARFVFSQNEKFERFVIVPSDSCLRVKYSLSGLIDNQRLAMRFLAFNRRIDPLKLALHEYRKDDLQMDITVPDLTALLCAFTQGFAGVPMGHAIAADNNGQLILERADRGIHHL